MRALRRLVDHTQLVELPRPEPAAGQVRLRVAWAGVCRTDLYVASGQLRVAQPVTLGHELSGVIEALGPGVDGLRVGQRVGVMPLLPCGQCISCLAQDPLMCVAPSTLGLDVDGGFADALLAPASAVWPIPDPMTLRQAAYLEPVAASLAVTSSPIDPSWRGLVVGQGRIGELTARVLAASGFERVERCSHELQALRALPEHSVDFIVETIADAPIMEALVRALRPRGVLVLKSRPASPVALDWRKLLAKGLTLHAAYYAPFERAIALLGSGALQIDDLLGPGHPLEAWADVFAAETPSSAAKTFFHLDPELT